MYHNRLSFSLNGLQKACEISLSVSSQFQIWFPIGYVNLVCVFYRSQQAFLQSNLSQPSPVVLSGATLHNFPGVQHQDLAKAQSSLAYQQTTNTQPISILYDHQLGQSGLGGSQLIDTHILQARLLKIFDYML